jgi:hypothetical protein
VARTDELIAVLASELRPVRRMAPPGRRAAIWLAATALLVVLIVLRFSSHPLIEQRLSVARMTLECLGSALTAVAAVMAAFELSVPGHSPHWNWVTVPPLLLWLGASGAGCLQNGSGLHTPYTHHMPSCFVFIVVVSIPLSLGLFWMLRRARPIAPLPVALAGALGVAATAATLLQFFHPFDITWLDLGFHLGAVAVIVTVAGALREALLAGVRKP